MKINLGEEMNKNLTNRQLLEKLVNDVSELKTDVSELKSKVSSIDDRLTKLENEAKNKG